MNSRRSLLTAALGFALLGKRGQTAEVEGQIVIAAVYARKSPEQNVSDEGHRGGAAPHPV
jgi:hypothetical protein